MQILDTLGSVIRLPPPPLWYVTNGDLTVGPVPTNLLIRGIEAGRVPNFCEVKAGAGRWRGITAVREVAALYGKAKTPSEQFNEWSRSAEYIKDEAEFAHTLTWLSALATSAENAMFHYRANFGRSLITRSVLGPMAADRLGYPLSEHDLVLKTARLARPIFGPPFGPLEDALAKRFASSEGGSGAVAMIPFHIEGQLIAMLELSRPGHAFRRTDLQRAERIIKRALRKRHS
ncbi:MAG TPA: hypothetical protein VFQ61_12850 [Polyangiaceae bacterium]|nr:hypothetical protein [Polyangiaceae bacterium]